MKKRSTNNRGSAPIKRTVARSGQVYYFQGGKRLPAAKAASKWVKDNFSAIQQAQLSERELRSFRGQQAARKGAEKIKAAAERRVRFGGKFVPGYLQDILEALKLIGPKTKDLKNEFPTAKTYGQLLKQLKPAIARVSLPATEWGLPNEKRRRETYKNIIDIAEQVTYKRTLEQLDLVVVDESGGVFTGPAALEAVRKWETAIIDDLIKNGGNPAYVSFNHLATIDPETKEMIIQLANSTKDTQYSP